MRNRLIIDPINEKDYLQWLDCIKGVAIVWIFLVHFIENFIPGSYFGNPISDWPNLTLRIRQLQPYQGSDISVVFANILRYVGWCGDQGVQLFVVASGFALTWMDLSRNEHVKIRSYISRRFSKIYPEWLILQIILIFTFILVGFGLNPKNYLTFLSLAGIRMLPSTMYYFSPAWWFFGLIIQFYFIFPFLYNFIFSSKSLIKILSLIAFSILCRLSGLLIFTEHLDWWSRGAIFISRMPEFMSGILFAYIMKEKKIDNFRPKESFFIFIISVVVYIIGNILSFFLTGMSIAFFMTGSALFVLFYLMFSKKRNKDVFFRWLGNNSLSIFLVHHIVIKVLVPTGLSIFDTRNVILLLVFSFLITLLLSILLKKFTLTVVVFFRRMLEKRTLKHGLFKLLIICLLISSFFLGIEMLIRTVLPQEVFGWGERPSLIKDERVGYKMIPDRKTKLKWMFYNYTVYSNSDGFPGPDFPETQNKAGFRIIISGDAFESAEGVDTDFSWPRKVENRLDNMGYDCDVINLSITGWGPQHYSRAVEMYARKYNPRLVIVAFFVNDFFDVNIQDADYNRYIGFDEPEQSSLYSFLKLSHTRGLLKRIKNDWLKSKIERKETDYGNHLSNLNALDISNYEYLQDSSREVKKHLISIKQAAADSGSDCLVVLVPSSVQVCDLNDLKYMPNDFDLNNNLKYDLEQPQNIAIGMLEELELEYFDLRAVLLQTEECPYQPRNMHWTEYGHEIVSEAVVDKIISMEGIIE